MQNDRGIKKDPSTGDQWDHAVQHIVLAPVEHIVLADTLTVKMRGSSGLIRVFSSRPLQSSKVYV